MPLPRRLIALASGALLVVSTSVISNAFAQAPAAPRNSGDSLILDDATFEFIQKSEVSPLTEGVLEKLELTIGKTVAKDGVIGTLHKKRAELYVAKAKLAANATGPIKKAQASYRQAIAVVARNERIAIKNPTLVPREDVEKANAELLATEAMIQEQEEAKAIAGAELDLAMNQLKDHTIVAPFAGVILKVLKQPSESVKANEPVVELGNLDKLRVFAFVPLETSMRLSEGSEVEFQLMIKGKRASALPIEQKKFRGVISFIDPQIQPQVETEVRIYADFPNESHELKPGMKGQLTLFLNAPGTTPKRPAAASTRGGEAPAIAAAPEAVPPAVEPAPAASNLPPLPGR
jgi:RND family efflux transporter MFP subunit